MMFRCSKALSVFLPATIGLFIGLCPALADPVTIDGKTADGFARLTFTWPSRVPFVARIIDKQLTVQFSRLVETSFEGLPGNLNHYIGQPRLGSGGKTVIFPLKNKYGLNFNARGRIVTVDLMELEPSSQGHTVSAPKSKELERVKVRVGHHANYGRLVFDWKNKVSYKVARKGDRTSIIFGRAANINVKSLNKRTAKFVGTVTSLIRGKATVVLLKFPLKSRVRHFSSGSKVVVDVFSPTVRSNAVEPKQLSLGSPKFQQTFAGQPASNPNQFVSSAPKKHQAKIMVPKEVATTKNTTSPKFLNQTPLKIAAPNLGQLSISPATRPQPKLQTMVASEVGTTSAALSLPLNAMQIVTPFNRKLPSIFFGFSRAQAQTTTNLSPADQTATIRFDWTEPVGAAVFKRAGALWIVFDKAKGFEMDRFINEAKGVILSADQVSAQKGTFLRFSTPAGINPSIRRDGNSWIFDFKKQPMVPKTPIQGRAEPASRIGPRIFIPVRQAGEPIPFHDAAVGDNLVVVPVIPFSHGIAKRQIFPKLQILPTAQGIVVQPKIDDLRVRTLTKGVQVSATSRLALSPTDPKAAAQSKILTLGTIKRVIGSDVWRLARREGMKNFNIKRQKMMADIAEANKGDKLGTRMVLAQHYFGQNFGYETLGVLKRIQNENPSFEADPKFRLLRGGSNFLIGRYAEAKKDLDHPSLNENDEGDFWRAINQAGSGKLAEAAPILKATGKVVVAYPKRIKMPLGMLIVDSAIKAGDIKFATNYLQMVSEEEPTPMELDQLALLEGKLQQLAGDFNAAVEAWESVAEGEHRPSVAHAIMRRVDLLLASKRMKTKEAIEELERIRFSWRGGDFEFNLLRKLGRSYLDNQNYRKGLNTLRSAVSFFRGHPAAPEVTQEMVSAFVKIYFTHAGENISALRAIALFDEFKELTPSGDQGDKMIQKLADRLAQVDLLGRAAKLLANQVDFRLKGVEKAKVGARLATVYLVNKQPALAEEAIINSDEKEEIPPYLVVQRRQLLARSFIDQGRENKALNLLEDDKTRYADLLRAEVYWKGRKWPGAARVFRRLISSFGGKPGEKINERQALFVMNLAISLALGGDERGSEKLRSDYGAAMSQTSLKDAFRLIASPDATGLVDSRTVANKVETVSNFKNFLASYEKRLKEGKLSQIN